MAAEMLAGDYSRVIADALAQVEAGAHMLDVNAGIPLADEPGMLAKAIQLVQSVTDVPLSIDSSIVAALEAGLAVYQGIVREVYRIERWLPACSLPYSTRDDVEQYRGSGRWEFEGHVATDVRDDYVDFSVGKGGQNPVRYVNIK